VSGPLLDRVDLQVEVKRIAYDQLRSDAVRGEPSAAVRQRVERAHTAQLMRCGKSNAKLDNNEVERHCHLDEEQHLWLAKALDTFNLSARAIHRTLKVARTIADMDGSTDIVASHLKEALSYRTRFAKPAEGNSSVKIENGEIDKTPEPVHWYNWQTLGEGSIPLDNIIDGKKFAASLRADVADKVAKIKSQHNIVPGLAVVLVGEDPASQVYVRNKGKQTAEAGMQSFEHKLPDTTSQAELMKLIDQLNADDTVHGILVQLPLPDQIEEEAVINHINPDKDVDGFHLNNVGRLAIGDPGIVPCTPLGCIMMLKDALGDLSGMHAVKSAGRMQAG